MLWSGLFGGLASTAPARDTQLRLSGDAEAASESARGIFRVWTVGEVYSRDTTDEGGEMEVPYLPAALAAREEYDPLTDDTALRCIPQGMPGIMDNPFPIEFLEQDGNVILRTEEWDVVRSIHITADDDFDSQLSTPHGYSVGRWDDDTLVITTTNIDWPFFDDIGTPQSKDVDSDSRSYFGAITAVAWVRASMLLDRLRQHTAAELAAGTHPFAGRLGFGFPLSTGRANASRNIRTG